MHQMKRLWLLILLLGCLSHAQQIAKDGKLGVVIRTTSSAYRVSDTVQLEIQLSNIGTTPLLIRRQLGWGVGRTDIRVFDANGKEVFTSFLAVELPPPFKQGDFIQLAPNQFYGQRVDEAATHFVNKPGSYTLIVNYTQPFTEKFIRQNLKLPDVPLWGRERGTTESNRITFIVTE
jgi:hypothetical protein